MRHKLPTLQTGQLPVKTDWRATRRIICSVVSVRKLGVPQCGQVVASLETLPEHSLQLSNIIAGRRVDSVLLFREVGDEHADCVLLVVDGENVRLLLGPDARYRLHVDAESGLVAEECEQGHSLGCRNEDSPAVIRMFADFDLVVHGLFAFVSECLAQ